MGFEFFRLRFHFQAITAVHFPAGGSANILRGAFGYILREIACTPACHGASHTGECAYARIFEPRRASGNGPSGFADLPRPFVFRTRHLERQDLQPTRQFSLDVHLFELNRIAVPYFIQAISRIGMDGFGPRRSRAKLILVEQLDSEDRVMNGWRPDQPAPPLAPTVITLVAAGSTPSVRLRFVTPTELKFDDSLADRPEFSVLFARIRDRVSTLCALYGDGPLDMDFRGMAERASRITMSRCELRTERAHRRSGRTGQVHSLGGFTGEAEYRGELGEFLPFLHAARWTGVGRQTVWGKGQIEVE